MTTLTLTLEERERRAYVENSPEHPFIVLAIDAENEALDEMRHEKDMAEDDRKFAEEQLEERETELEKSEELVAELQGENDRLREELSAAAKTSTAPPATKKPRAPRVKKHEVADLL